VRSSKASEAELAAFRRRASGGKGPYIAVGIAAVIAVGWVGRDKLSVLAGSAAKADETAVLKASSKQDGVKLVVDGKDIGTLPQEIKGLTPGEHSIVFEGGDRYAPQKSTVVIGPNETKELDPVSLKVSKGAATFDVKTPGAALALVASDERRALTDYSRPIDVDTSKSWTLEATKTGFKTLRLPVTFDDQANKTFSVTLDPDKGGVDVAALPADTGAADNAPAPAGKAAKGARVAPAAKAEPAEAPKASAAGSGPCTLNFNSIPASRIVLDGRPLGMTPKMGVSASAGSHSVLFVADGGTKKSTSATCKAGETKTVAVRIAQ
jgi:serine/threonine-protein kinase